MNKAYSRGSDVPEPSTSPQSTQYYEDEELEELISQQQSEVLFYITFFLGVMTILALILATIILRF